jgi:hypothetical protein
MLSVFVFLTFPFFLTFSTCISKLYHRRYDTGGNLNDVIYTLLQPAITIWRVREFMCGNENSGTNQNIELEREKYQSFLKVIFLLQSQWPRGLGHRSL